jgi:hypothetical protein
LGVTAAIYQSLFQAMQPQKYSYDSDKYDGAVPYIMQTLTHDGLGFLMPSAFGKLPVLDRETFTLDQVDTEGWVEIIQLLKNYCAMRSIKLGSCQKWKNMVINHCKWAQRGLERTGKGPLGQIYLLVAEFLFPSDFNFIWEEFVNAYGISVTNAKCGWCQPRVLGSIECLNHFGERYDFTPHSGFCRCVKFSMIPTLHDVKNPREPQRTVPFSYSGFRKHDELDENLIGVCLVTCNEGKQTQHVSIYRGDGFIHNATWLLNSSK